jgi:hypothetical protein
MSTMTTTLIQWMESVDLGLVMAASFENYLSDPVQS